MVSRGWRDTINVFLVRMEGLEPTHLAAPDPKSGMSTNFTTSAVVFKFSFGAFSKTECKDRRFFKKKEK